mgnify:CR=1 FL=1
MDNSKYMMNIGEKAPEVLGINEKGEEILLGNYKGKKIVLYFDLTWLFLTTIMFYSPVKRVGNQLHFNKRGENIDYSRWITKTKNKIPINNTVFKLVIS